MELNEQPCFVALRIKDAFKSYSPSALVLRGLNMTVLQGTIYGLLGPSGCGKTTLLKCVVGRCQLDSGCIYLKINDRKKIGYMPQELALTEQMTIAEAFNYFGRLYGMSWKQIKTRGEEMIEFLELPKASRVIDSLSGGQRRRVSFAVALLHDPDLLILDEPTVGIDPILSNSIWQNLVKMAQLQSKTIIITTHYIEEARQANMIGLMRKGIIIAEDTPSSLILSQNCATLEHAFLELSKKQIDLPPINLSKLPPAAPPPLKKESYWVTDRYLAQLVKNFVWNLRNLHMLLFVLALPILLTILASEAIGGEQFRSPVGIMSSELENGIQDCRTYGNAHHYNCTYTSKPLSCIFIDSLIERHLDVKDIYDLDTARNSLAKGHVLGVVHFSKNYTYSVYQRIIDGHQASSDIVDESVIDVWVDSSNLWLSLGLKRDLIEETLKMFQDLFANCHSSPKLAMSPIRIEKPVYGSVDNTYIHFCLPGFLVSFAFYLPVIYTTGAMLYERVTGQFERSLISGLNMLELVLAHITIQGIFMLLQFVSMFFVIYGVYSNPVYGSTLSLFTLLVSVGALGIAFAFCLTAIFDSETLATYTSTGAVVFIFTGTGVVWPIEGMYKLMRQLSWVFPLQPAIRSYRAIAYQAHSFSDPTVFTGYISTIIWVGILLTSAYIIAKKRNLFG